MFDDRAKSQVFAALDAFRIEIQGEDDWPWYPLNEGGAQRLNESDTRRLAAPG
jgi:hypothetical protein